MTRDEPVPFCRSVRCPNELPYLEQALAGGQLHGDGSFSHRARALLTDVVGATTLLTTSCTHALEMMALLFDIQAGDEVVVPSFTFPSTANAFVLRGARLRFADIDPATWTMELPQLEAALTPQTKAVCLMAYGGVSRDVEAMVALCQRRGILVGEDAAHGLFARKGGRPMGTFAPLGTLSFHNTKNISCGEGGALIVSDERFLERAHVVREKGTDRTRFLRGEIDKYTWRDAGSSWLPSDVLAALLTAQLEHREHLQAQRRKAWDVYARVLRPHAGRLGLQLQHIPDDVEHPSHVFAVVLPEVGIRARILAALAGRFHCVSHYEPLHLSSAGLRFGDAPGGLPVTESVAGRLVRLPLYSDLSEDTAAAVGAAFVHAVEQALSSARCG